MFYTIRFINADNNIYQFKVETPFETYFVLMPPNYSSPLLTKYSYWTYDDSSKNYRFFKDTGEEITVDLTEELKTECDNVLNYYHSVFDADQVQRAVKRVSFHLEQTFPFKDIYNNSLYFYSSFGFRVKGDWYFKEYLSDTIESLTDDTTTIVLTDYDMQTHNLTRPQLQHLLTELRLNLKYIEEQRIDYLNQIKNLNNVSELNDLQTQGFEYTMKDFRALRA